MSGFMDLAIEAALNAAKRDEVPVGAVISKGRNVIAIAGNQTRQLNDPTAHAEMIAIRKACEILGSERLTDCDLTVTLEPCTMCAGAISFARIGRLYFAAEDAKGGAVENGVRFFDQPSCHHIIEVYPGIQETRAGNILKEFFASKR